MPAEGGSSQLRAQQSRQAGVLFLSGGVSDRSDSITPARPECGNVGQLVEWHAGYAHNRSRIASAASLARVPVSPAGPTHEGQPLSQEQPAISSRVFCTS